MNGDPLKVMEDTADVVAAITGMKAQFIASGWSDIAAEQMTIEIWRAGTAGRMMGQ